MPLQQRNVFDQFDTDDSYGTGGTSSARPDAAFLPFDSALDPSQSRQTPDLDPTQPGQAATSGVPYPNAATRDDVPLTTQNLLDFLKAQNRITSLSGAGASTYNDLSGFPGRVSGQYLPTFAPVLSLTPTSTPARPRTDGAGPQTQRANVPPKPPTLGGRPARNASFEGPLTPPLDARGNPKLPVGGPQELLRGYETPSVTGYRLTLPQEAAIRAALRQQNLQKALQLTQVYSHITPTARTIKSAKAVIANVAKNPNFPIRFNYGDVDQAAKAAAEEKKYRGHLDQERKSRQHAGARPFLRGVRSAIPYNDEIAAGVRTLVNGHTYADNLGDENSITKADQELHPVQRFTGGLLGNVLVGQATGIGLARLGGYVGDLAEQAGQYDTALELLLKHPVTADVVSSGLDPVLHGQNPLPDVTSGIVGGSIGRALGGGGAEALEKARSHAVDALIEDKVRLSPGQILGTDNPLGKVVNWYENGISKIPFLGAQNNARRYEAFQQFDQAAHDKLPGLADGQPTRSTPPRLLELYDQAKSYAPTGSDVFTPENLRLASLRGALRTRGTAPFFDLANKGLAVLGNSLPTQASMRGRVLFPLAATGAATLSDQLGLTDGVSPYVAGYSLLNTPQGLAIMQKLLTNPKALEDALGSVGGAAFTMARPKPAE